MQPHQQKESTVELPKLNSSSSTETSSLTKLPSIGDLIGFSSHWEMHPPFEYFRAKFENNFSNTLSQDFNRFASMVQNSSPNVYPHEIGYSIQKLTGKRNLSPSSSEGESSPERHVGYLTPPNYELCQPVTCRETPSEDGSFQCKWDHCSLSFLTRTGLATHCSTHITGDESTRNKRQKLAIPCKWASCTRVFETTKHLAKHLAEEDHIGQTPFLSKSENEEVDRVQLAKKRYACSFPGCGKSFTDSSNRKVPLYFFHLTLEET